MGYIMRRVQQFEQVSSVRHDQFCGTSLDRFRKRQRNIYVINYYSVNNGNSRPTSWVIVEQIFKLLYMKYSVNEFPVSYLREVLVRIHWWFKI